MADDIKQRLDAVKLTVSDPRIRWLIGKGKDLIEEGNVYGEKISKDEYDKLMEESIANEIIRKQILTLVNTEPLSVKLISEKIGLHPSEVFKNIIVLLRKGMIEIDKVEGSSPFYRSSLLKEGR
jgi:predicted Rossmann fold nucleotide-binding protein DprA/Smf involved in DNA uptake